MPKKIFLAALALFFALTLIIWVNPMPTRADQLDDINKQLSELNDALNKSVAATKPLQSELDSMQKQIAGIKTQVANVEADTAIKRKEISQETANLEQTQKKLALAIQRDYINNYKICIICDLLLRGNDDVSEKTLKIMYDYSLAQRNKEDITQTVYNIVELEKKKVSLEQEQKWLIATKTDLDAKSAKLDEVVKGARDYQAKLSNQIAQLNAQQQQIVAQKLGSLNIPRSAGTSARGCSSDLTNGKDPGFSPRIGFFTYGAPHRNGLNQYGAFGRAKAGQSEETILSAYYPNMTLKKDYDQSSQVNVDGYGTFSIEDYVKRIWEVPNSWGDEGGMNALKAQAVAARTYALNSMQRNGHICTTESCQVFRPDPKGGNWDQAVEATKGWVLMDGGNPGFSQYASTHGGYILNLGKFDGEGTPTSFAELNAKAYDKESPWFYCNWGSRSQYSGTAWLKSDEVADIFNVIQLARFSDVDKDHLYQPDKPNPAGKETWGPDKVRSELQAHGGSALTNVSDISVSVDFGSGKTTSISTGGISISASEFKDWFNLRAPANIQIVGPLYNVEKQ